ncbi:YqjK-like family protein [Citrobacter sp. JGM124]|uniref:YqjK-like family protein n=1 Tax=Citrobacter sp. JGM124 TaxID=2799789 RepID=UPI001BA6A023|nr:YqjK-like family protein [Citrobacter sp. JGM124]MBS0849197.1 YqjK-like family protein [Citrobacter sp. JGM124]
MSDTERDQRKAALLIQVQQQRIDLSMAKQDWLEVTAPYDRGWGVLVSLRRYFVVAGGMLAIWNIRRPGRIVPLAKRGLSLWSTWRVMRTSLNKLFFNR